MRFTRNRRAYRQHPLWTFLSARIDELLALLEGKTADQSMHWWSTWGPNVSPPLDLTVNPALWCPALPPLLTGLKLYADHGGYQAAGGLAVTPRHLLAADHDSPTYGLKVGHQAVFGNPQTGATFTTTVSQRVYAEGDATLLLLADELPAWVTITPLLLLSEVENSLLALNAMPYVRVSQGNVSAADDPDSLTPRNMKIYLGSGSGAASPSLSAYAADFTHNPVPGDSGMPAFVLIDGQPHVINLQTATTWRSAAQIALLNQAIADCDALAGIDTGCSLTVNESPIPNLPL